MRLACALKLNFSTWQRSGSALVCAVVEGMFSDKRGLLALRSRRMTGVMGAYRFDLFTDDGLSYRGESNSNRPVEVVLSPGIVALPAREQAAVLAIFLRH